jgi:hypothetical protein
MTHEGDDVRDLVARVFRPVQRHGFERQVLDALSAASRGASGGARSLRSTGEANGRGTHGFGGPRPRRWPVRAALASAAAAVVAAAGLLGIASPFRQAPAAPGVAAAGGMPSIQTIDARLLAAREAHSDEIVHQVITATGGTAQQNEHVESWIWPASEQPGAEVRARTLVPGRFDQEQVFVAPQYLDSKGGSVTGELIGVDFASRTWSDQQSTTFTPFGSAAVVDFHAGIEAGYFRVAGIVRLDRRRAIQLNEVKNGQVQTFRSIFIDTDTYLPIKQVSKGNGVVQEFDFEFLPPTAGNLAKLRPVVPPGFQQTAAPPPVPAGRR